MVLALTDRCVPPSPRLDALVDVRQPRLLPRAFCPPPVLPEMGAGAARFLCEELQVLVALAGYPIRQRALSRKLYCDVDLRREGDAVKGEVSLPPSLCHYSTSSSHTLHPQPPQCF